MFIMFRCFFLNGYMGLDHQQLPARGAVVLLTAQGGQQAVGGGLNCFFGLQLLAVSPQLAPECLLCSGALF
jgi:hypothetical protein